MLILVTGVNGSGKSVWAEALAAKLNQGRLIYIATMIPYGEEGLARVERHREQRRNSGFITREVSHDLSRVEIEAGDTVLLEDVANLTANALFAAEQPGEARAVLAEITELAARCRLLIAVTISGINPADEYDAPTLHYIEALRQVNEGLFDLANAVFELKGGQALPRKGAELCLC